MPIRVAARSKAWNCGRSLAGIVGSNPTREHRYLSVLFVLPSKGLCVMPITHPEEC